MICEGVLEISQWATFVGPHCPSFHRADHRFNVEPPRPKSGDSQTGHGAAKRLNQLFPSTVLYPKYT